MIILLPSRMGGKQMLLEAVARRTGAVLARPDGVYRWDGDRWQKIPERELRPAWR
jgi:hypothetical protein